MPVEKPSIAELLRQTSILEAVSDSARLDLEVLLCHVLKKPRSYLFTWPEKVLDQQSVKHFNDLLKRRADGEPIAYLTGEKEFWSLSLEVNAATLIPRPDTELLVETTLDLLDKASSRVLDLGTGTGAIALALASERPAWEIIAVDTVAEAVALAEKNRQRLGLENVSVVRSDWFEDLAQQKFELIVSNPPYIDANDHHLNEGDVRFEPGSALVSGNKGLADIEVIICGARKYLNEGGYLLMEHGYQQAGAVRDLLRAEGCLQVSTRKDIAGHERLTLGRF
ncbi:MAG: peptide chain release factor N(5)-glutamine methyltransferase [Gammaproteobacteria bacterium]|nr:peptide chain release factor N(5)-glutamine methyltransferase [Gammaproteobacteria bacterium]MBQ0839560.1 peptide chain release factor N(5)-glutamine methyltransferase [Gammaproteobacteria bacterium]